MGSEPGEVPVVGVVTGIFWSSAGGFFLQDREAGARGAAGIFVEGGAALGDVREGEWLWLRGRVLSRSGGYRLSPVESARCGVVGLPQPRVFELPHGGAEELGRSDATLVSLVGPLSLGAFEFSDDTELGLRVVRRRPRTREEQADGREGWRLVLPPGALPGAGGRWPRLGDGLEPTLAVYDSTLGSGALRPLRTPRFVVDNPRPLPPDAPGAARRIGALNLGNYFRSLRRRGAATALERYHQEQKLLAALAALDADVLGLLEVENDDGSTERALLDALNARVSTPYEAAPAPLVAGSDAIRSVLFHRPSRITPVPGSADEDARPVHRRPVRAQSFEFAGRRVSVLLVHAKSRSCAGAGLAQADVGEGCFHAERIDQSRALLEFVAERRAAAGSDDVIVLGDFNAYPGERSLEWLEAGGLVDALSTLPAPSRYSYVFEGVPGLLDHSFVSASLRTDVTRAGIWHVNADEPVAIDYRHPADPGFALDEFRSSDHDPIWLDLAAPSAR